MPRSLPLLTHVRIELAAFALAGAGFWLVPDDPAFPALLLTAVALPLALLGGLALWILERRERARTKAAGARASAPSPSVVGRPLSTPSNRAK